MQRTGTRERACGSGTGQNPLAEHAQHAPQPRSIAWGGGGEAAMKGGAPCFLRDSRLALLRLWPQSLLTVPNTKGREVTVTTLCGEKQ